MRILFILLFLGCYTIQPVIIIRENKCESNTVKKNKTVNEEVRDEKLD